MVKRHIALIPVFWLTSLWCLSYESMLKCFYFNFHELSLKNSMVYFKENSHTCYNVTFQFKGPRMFHFLLCSFPCSLLSRWLTMLLLLLHHYRNITPINTQKPCLTYFYKIPADQFRLQASISFKCPVKSNREDANTVTKHTSMIAGHLLLEGCDYPVKTAVTRHYGH